MTEMTLGRGKEMAKDWVATEGEEGGPERGEVRMNVWWSSC